MEQTAADLVLFTNQASKQHNNSGGTILTNDQDMTDQRKTHIHGHGTKAMRQSTMGEVLPLEGPG